MKLDSPEFASARGHHGSRVLTWLPLLLGIVALVVLAGGGGWFWWSRTRSAS